MKVGDMVKYETDTGRINNLGSRGIIVAESPGLCSLAAHTVSVLWSSGELVERVPPRILEVISEGG